MWITGLGPEQHVMAYRPMPSTVLPQDGAQSLDGAAEAIEGLEMAGVSKEHGSVNAQPWA